MYRNLVPELSEEQRAGRSTRPPTRRWKQLAKHDEKVDQATQRHADALAALQQAEARLQQAPDADARSLADWIAGGEGGDRPESSVYQLTRERDAARLQVEAAALELDKWPKRTSRG